MPSDRLRSIVPMFGGGTNYVDTLDAIVEFVDGYNPTTDELVGWHRGTFATQYIICYRPIETPVIEFVKTRLDSQTDLITNLTNKIRPTHISY